MNNKIHIFLYESNVNHLIMQLIIFSFMNSQLYNPLTNLSNLKLSFSIHRFRTLIFSNAETRLKFWILISPLSNSLLGENFI